MNSLETTRICIIDDEVNEYLPLIYALSQLRLGCIHISGDRVEDLPDRPLDGIRLVFLDMQLGTAGDMGQITAQTANVFGRVISPNDGPVLVVIWTKHADYISEFRRRLYDQFGQFRGRLIFIRLEKPATLQLDKTLELQEAIQQLRDFVPALQQSIKDALGDSYPIELLWRWEQLAHDAASTTTAAIASHATNRAKITLENGEEAEAKKLRDGLAQILRLLIESEAGENLTSKTAFSDLMNVLNPLHQDRLEHAFTEDDTSIAKRLLDIAKPQSSGNESVEINTMLLLSERLSGYSPFRPGTVLQIQNVPTFDKRWACSFDSITAEFLKSNKITKLEDQLSDVNLEESRREPLQRELEKEKLRVKARVDKCVPILLEISPGCDFAQNKSRLGRFVAGLLVPNDEINEFQDDQGAFKHLIRKELKIPKLDANYRVIFCSRFVFGIDPMCNIEDHLVPLCRLREAALAEIRNWVSGQSSRSGFLSI